jgi:hypothetical protein
MENEPASNRIKMNMNDQILPDENPFGLNGGITPYVLIGMPVTPDCFVDLYAAVWCGMWSMMKNVEFMAKAVHETAYARNLIIMDALKKDYITHVFFIDADTRPPTDCLHKLLKLNKDVAAGLYKISIPEPEREGWSASTASDTTGKVYNWLPTSKELPKEPFTAWALAGGCMLVKKEVLQKITWPWFEYIYQPNGQRMGEDIYFTNKVKEAGFELWVEPSVICGHNQRRVR